MGGWERKTASWKHKNIPEHGKWTERKQETEGGKSSRLSKKMNIWREHRHPWDEPLFHSKYFIGQYEDVASITLNLFYNVKSLFWK